MKSIWVLIACWLGLHRWKMKSHHQESAYLAGEKEGTHYPISRNTHLYWICQECSMIKHRNVDGHIDPDEDDDDDDSAEPTPEMPPDPGEEIKQLERMFKK